MINLFRKKKKDNQLKLSELLDGYEIPSFPAIVIEVLNDLRIPDIGLGQIANKLEQDPGMQVKILKTVNSAAFGLSREVTNLHNAISIMGHSRLETILLAHAVKSSLPHASTENFSMTQFWQSAARRACLARAVARRLHPATQVESFTAGLLQDMAVPVLVAQKRQEYVGILEMMASDQSAWLHELESDKLPYDHSDVGGCMAREWGLPEYLVGAISSHHDEDSDSGVEPGIRLASFVRDRVEPECLAAMYAFAEKVYGLEKGTMDVIVECAFAEAEEFASRLF
ncbi:MAG: HDOD domain-containing protein [bacterium]